MVFSDYILSDREFNFKLNRINWLDQEITRYRDYEWKATSVHTAFFVAILYLLINPDTQQNLINAISSNKFGSRIIIILAIYLYIIFACLQLVDIHDKLDKSRQDRDKFLEKIGERYNKDIEKSNFDYISVFIGWLIVLCLIDIILLFNSKPFLCFTSE